VDENSYNASLQEALGSNVVMFLFHSDKDKGLLSIGYRTVTIAVTYACIACDAHTASGQSDAPGQPDTPGQPDAPVGHRDLMTWDHGSFMNFNILMIL